MNFAVRITGVIDIAGEIGERLAIDVIALIQFKDVGVSRRGPLGTFGFGNLVTQILDNPGAFLNLLGRKESLSVNGRWANTNHISPSLCRAHRLFPLLTFLLRITRLQWVGKPNSGLNQAAHGWRGGLHAAVIPKFITAWLKHKPLPVYGDGQQSRDFTYVDNVVHGNVLAMTAPGVAGQVINLANGTRTI